MDRHCILCDSKIKNIQEYQNRKKTLIKTTRYQDIIDILLDSPALYDQIFFDHDTELLSPYRNIALHKRSALQEELGKGRHLHKKWPDITAICKNTCNIIIEEERQPKIEVIDNDIQAITKCKYLWVNEMQYCLVEPYLFILLNENVNNISNSIHEQNIGIFKKVIVCEKSDFESMYEENYL